uniref:Uncharacterized protein n=1 Tax=viral metagenome TaxID=1070528 RepID=A0A6C0JMC1_9ZZZZ
MSNQTLTYEDYNLKSVSVRGDRNKFTNIIKKVKGRWNPRMKGGEGWLVGKEFVPKLQEIINSMDDVKNVIKDDVKNVIKDDVKKVIQDDIKKVIQDDIKKVIQDDIKKDVKVKLIKKKKSKYYREHSELDSDSELNEKSESESSDSDKESSESDKKSSESDESINKKKITQIKDKNTFKNRVTNKVIPKKELIESVNKNNNKNVLQYYKSFSKKPGAFNELYEEDSNKYSSSSYNSSSSDDFPEPVSPRRKAYKRNDDDYDTLFNKVNDLQKRLHHVEIKQKK